MIDTLRNLALSCPGQNRRFIIGRDLMPKLRKVRLATGAPLVTEDWETILGLPFDLAPGGRVGIVCDAPE